MKTYKAYKSFPKFKGKVYPIGSEFINKDGMLVNDDGNMCLVGSEKSRQCLVGNDDGLWKERGKLINEIRDLIDLSANKADVMIRRYDWIFADKIAYKYGQNHNQDTDAWIWNDDFYTANIKDLEYIKQKLLEV